jgi:protein-S-isoprenylcysteine O-methyltransferase Ste14
MTQTGVVESPWWYRLRGTIFALIYATGFSLAALFASLTHRAYTPAFVVLGSHWGRSGVLAIAALALLCMILCYAVRVWGSSYLLPEIVWDPNARTDAFITDGPFRYTRNPLYLGNVLMALGLGALAPPIGWAFINLADLLFVIILIRWEESVMQAHWGNEFAVYSANVPSLFPRWTPFAGRVYLKPSLRAGLRSEIFTGALLLGMIALLVFPSYGGWAFLAFFILGYFMQRRLDRAASS